MRGHVHFIVIGDHRCVARGIRASHFRLCHQARKLLGSKLDPSSAPASLNFVPLASLMVLVSNFKL
jgi:hypothetical protein